jgi:hypothetical protein
MKKIVMTLLPAILLAKSFILSDIPLPKTYIQNLDPYPCSESCMQEYLENDMIFSFLAHADKKLQDNDLDEARSIYLSLLNLGAFNANTKVKIAILLPYKRIGKYAASTLNASFAYLMTKTNPFELKSYKIDDESPQTIAEALSSIKNDGFMYVIAPLTKNGAQTVIDIDPTLHIYFPTINKNSIERASQLFTFGAIDYKAQSDYLLEYASSPLVVFSDKSTTGKKLAMYQEEIFKEEHAGRVIKYFISRKTTNLEGYLKKNRRIYGGTFIINTPIIKSCMILSQLTLYDADPRKVLSTQINYNPLLLSMTQYNDRKKMLIANSIIQNNNVVVESNSILANDIVYDWINYATTVGVDYFYSQITGEQRDYKIPVTQHQVEYPIEIIKPGISKFDTYSLKK